MFINKIYPVSYNSNPCFSKNQPGRQVSSSGVQSSAMNEMPSVSMNYFNPGMDNFILGQAINFLSEVEFSQEDIAHMENMGVNIAFNSGKEAVDYIRDKNISIKFAPLPSLGHHAQFQEDNGQKDILINEAYSNTRNFADILAISEAVLHETTHAKDDDVEASIQEEFDALAMNALANRYHSRKYPYVFEASSSNIVNDGVVLYSKLFFDEDPKKTALLKRIDEKYGSLPLESPNHNLKENSILKGYKFNTISFQ